MRLLHIDPSRTPDRSHEDGACSPPMPSGAVLAGIGGALPARLAGREDHLRVSGTVPAPGMNPWRREGHEVTIDRWGGASEARQAVEEGFTRGSSSG
jgi:hypothetical protein